MLFTLIRKLLQNRSDTSARLIGVLYAAFALNLVFGLGFYFAERGHQEGLSLPDSLWWAMVTMTTVGYGDYFPKSFVVRFLVGYPCFIVGIGLLGYLLATVTETVLERVSKKRKGAMKISETNHIIICNCPSVEKTLQLLDELEGTPGCQGKPVVLVTNDFQELPGPLKKRGVLFVRGLPTQEETLFQANILKCAGVFILPARPDDPACDAQSYAIGSIIEMIEAETGTPIKTVVEVVSSASLKMMHRAGTDGLVVSDKLKERLIVQEFLYPGIHKTFEQLTTSRTGSQFYVHPTSLAGASIRDLQIAALDHPANIQVVGIVKQGEHHLNPSTQTIVESGDQLIILADQLEDFLSIERDIEQKRVR